MDKAGRIRRGVGWVVAIAMAVGAAKLPADMWLTVARRAALAAVTLQHADEAATALSKALCTRMENGVSVQAALVNAQSDLYTETAPANEIPSAPAPSTPAMQQPPAEDGTGGKIVRQTIGGGHEAAGIHFKNKSDVSVDLAAALAADLPFTVECGTDQPQVLIYHTHTTEGYMPYDAAYYNDGDIRREPDYPYNVTVVGDAIEQALTDAGIRVIHVKDLYDYPSYRGAYERSVVMMEEMLKKYPSIKVTLDIHRDGLMANSKDKLRPVASVGGKDAAQVMLVCGVLSTEKLPHPNWQKNLSFATKLQQKLETDCPGLARPLSLTGARYNQYLTTGSLLVEVGSDGNTLADAVYAGELLGKELAALIGKGT